MITAAPRLGLSLWQRLSMAFVGLLLACFAATAWLQMQYSQRQGQHVEQLLLRKLAGHVAAEAEAVGSAGLDATRLVAVVQRLALTNPGVELYVLDASGRITMRYPDVSTLERIAVDLAPVRRFIEGSSAPVLGDDPLSTSGRKAFSAAAYATRSGEVGYVYAVLRGSAYEAAAAASQREGALQIAVWSVGVVAPLGLVAGLLAFRRVTRPLTELTLEVEQLELLSRGAPDRMAGVPTPAHRGDEIAALRAAFRRLAVTNDRQWQSLSQQDQQRRELVASISHDLRTPLASLHGYLESLLLKGPQLEPVERERYLHAALAQSRRVGSLAQELLELARLELGTVKPAVEPFSLVDLTLDVLQKLALAASAKYQRIEPQMSALLPDVAGDISMIERVLTNLLDNAIRHTPEGGVIRVRLEAAGDRVRVEVVDSGPGVASERRASLFVRPAQRVPGHEGSGLGLVIVRQMLQLHGSDIELRDAPGHGAAFVFDLAVSRARAPADAGGSR